MINQIPDKPAMGSLVGLSPAPLCCDMCGLDLYPELRHKEGDRCHGLTCGGIAVYPDYGTTILTGIS